MGSIFSRGRSPNRGEKITASMLSNLAAASGQGRAQFGGAVIGSQGPGGSGLFVRRSFPSSGSSTSPLNYKIYLALDTGSTYYVSFYPGTVNGLLTDNVLTVFTENISSTLYVILTCTSDGYAVTDSTISFSSTAPAYVDATVNSPPTTFSILLGILFVPSGGGSPTIYQLIQDNIVASPNLWIQTSNPSPVPFGNPFQNYYNWKITAASTGIPV